VVLLEKVISYDVFFSFLPLSPPLEGDMGEGVLCVSAVNYYEKSV
jgi:hypothetical protein